jgi:hypothetical protein
MQATEPYPFITDPLPDVVSTSRAGTTPVSVDPGQKQAEWKNAWQRLIDHQLLEWGRDPGQLEDEGVEPPSVSTILAAIQLAQRLRDRGSPPPDATVPDPNGGIVFERQEQDISEVFHVWDDETVEYRCFQGTRLVDRRTY